MTVKAGLWLCASAVSFAVASLAGVESMFYGGDATNCAVVMLLNLSVCVYSGASCYEEMRGARRRGADLTQSKYPHALSTLDTHWCSACQFHRATISCQTHRLRFCRQCFGGHSVSCSEPCTYTYDREPRAEAV